jgi:hypothetical protein
MGMDNRLKRLLQLYRTEAKIAANWKDEARRLFWVKKWHGLATEKDKVKMPKYLREA